MSDSNLHRCRTAAEMNALGLKKYLMNSYFTPGPWQMSEDQLEIRKFWIDTEDELGGIQVIADVKEGIQGDHEANACLIAAAPDLYNACVRIRHELVSGEMFPDPEIEKLLETVIKKAHGV